ncbi:MAG: hypothetical protein ACLQIB_39710 [Isosphaeraceae bacterium]
MNTQPGATQRESAWVAIVLSPLRAVERMRGWRRLALVALYGIIALVTCALGWRHAQLAKLPDVGDPFAGAALRLPARVPDDRNAFFIYRRAVERFQDMNEAESASFSKANFSWLDADATFRGWVMEHDEGISLLCAGSDKPDCLVETPTTAAERAATIDNNALCAHLSWIGTAALFMAARLRSEGDPSGAWRLLKAVVRASRHIEWAVSTADGRSVGIGLIQYASEPVADWANDPAVGVPLLRRALDDLAAAESLTPPLSTFYRREYLIAVESLKNLQPLIAARAQARHDLGRWHVLDLAPRLEAFLSGEPERSRRVLNLLVANDVAWCDRPVALRPEFAGETLHIFVPDPAAPAAARAVAPEQLARLAESALIAPNPSWRMGELDKWERIDRWSLRELNQAVVVSLFTKEMGRAPASPAEAFRRYRPLPGDSPDRDEAEPLP